MSIMSREYEDGCCKVIENLYQSHITSSSFVTNQDSLEYIPDLYLTHLMATSLMRSFTSKSVCGQSRYNFLEGLPSAGQWSRFEAFF